MHYGDVEDAVLKCEPAVLRDIAEDTCAQACYRCLLSYFNQPDHELINRRNEDAQRILLMMARGEVTLAPNGPQAAENGWAAALESANLPAPDAAGMAGLPSRMG
jgi:hypothetical protein